MKRIILTFFFSLILALQSFSASKFSAVPKYWKWLSDKEIAFSYDAPIFGVWDFSFDISKGNKRLNVSVEGESFEIPNGLNGSDNVTLSPDKSKLAYTRKNDLYVFDFKENREFRITSDGSDVILNGYASWVYYEEIFGRGSHYRAFWWSEDSEKLAFYRFDDSSVPMFPIYSPRGQEGTLRETRYPKCGKANPKVDVCIFDLNTERIVSVDFEREKYEYFGLPFWSADSRSLFVSTQPREQNEFDLYKVNAFDGTISRIYNEKAKTWLNWNDNMLFTSKGMYMVREFQTGWQQIYFLSYDGKLLKRLTSGPNWRVELLRVDEKNEEVYFLAERHSRVKKALYKLTKKGEIVPLTDVSMNAEGVSFSPDGKHFVVKLSAYDAPPQVWIFSTKEGKYKYKVAEQESKQEIALIPKHIEIKTKDGLRLPGFMILPIGFDASKRYPVHVDIYGGPDTPLVRERWIPQDSNMMWFPKNGIIEVVADCRAAGHNGRRGLDAIYMRLSEKEVSDFVDWADYLKSLPYVDGDKIGVEGFSFGGTMAALLVMKHSDKFHYGIAGGGVYDWSLYDTHYTERFMNTPENNKEGYESTKAVGAVANYPVNFENDKGDVMLMITHGTADDNVHFQSSLQLIDALQKAGKKFEMMIYPDALHGYRGYQGEHSLNSNRDFWLKYLKNE